MIQHLKTSHLKNTEGKIILSDLKIADAFWDRAVGLLGLPSLAEQTGLYIMRTNSIHTCFMKFSIDCIFLNSEMKVKKIVTHVKPWRLVLPVIGANAVIEVASGVAKSMNLKKGDTVYVSH